MCFFFHLLSTWIFSDRFWNKSSLWKFYCNQRRENMAGICTHSFGDQSLLLRTVWGLPPNLPFLTIVDVELKLVMLNSRDFDISRCLKVENLRNILSYSLFWTCARLFETLDTEYCPSLARTICCRQGKDTFHTRVKRSYWLEEIKRNISRQIEFNSRRWPQCRCVGTIMDAMTSLPLDLLIVGRERIGGQPKRVLTIANFCFVCELLNRRCHCWLLLISLSI